LFGAEYRRTTLQLWLLWFGTASAYYGVILAQSEILERNDICSGEDWLLFLGMCSFRIVLVFSSALQFLEIEYSKKV